jgi:hypothetical protein
VNDREETTQHINKNITKNKDRRKPRYSKMRDGPVMKKMRKY